MVEIIDDRFFRHSYFIGFAVGLDGRNYKTFGLQFYNYRIMRLGLFDEQEPEDYHCSNVNCKFLSHRDLWSQES